MQIQTLAIVGNGFDLAHSLPTSYAQFKDSQETASVASFQQFVAKYCPESSEWTSFEDRINDLSMSCFQQSHDDAFDYDSVISDVQEINKVFEAIRSSLLTYLKRVVYLLTAISWIAQIGRFQNRWANFLMRNGCSKAD